MKYNYRKRIFLKDTNFADTSIPKYLNIIVYRSTRWKTYKSTIFTCDSKYEYIAGCL